MSCNDLSSLYPITVVDAESGTVLTQLFGDFEYPVAHFSAEYALGELSGLCLFINYTVPQHAADACGCQNINRSPKHGGVAWAMWVDPSFRKSGLGTKVVIDSYVELLSALGLPLTTEACVYVNSATSAVGFWTNLLCDAETVDPATNLIRGTLRLGSD